MSLTVVKNATCTYCGCVCDDIELHADGERIVETKRACILGEVKNRADLIIYWGGNPAECHPRHFTKYTLTQKGKFVPNGRKGRTMVLVDIRETPSVRASDLFLQIRPGKDFEVVTALRALIKGRRVDPQRAAETGLTVEQLQDFADRMKRARF